MCAAGNLSPPRGGNLHAAKTSSQILEIAQFILTESFLGNKLPTTVVKAFPLPDRREPCRPLVEIEARGVITAIKAII